MLKIFKFSLSIAGAILLLWAIVPLVYALIAGAAVGQFYTACWAYLVDLIFSKLGWILAALWILIFSAQIVYGLFLDPVIQEKHEALEKAEEEAIRQSRKLEGERIELAEEFKAKRREDRKAIHEEEKVKLAQQWDEIEREKARLQDKSAHVEEREAKVKTYIVQKREAEKALARKKDELHTLWGTIGGARTALEEGNSQYALKILSRNQLRRKRPSR